MNIFPLIAGPNVSSTLLLSQAVFQLQFPVPIGIMRERERGYIQHTADLKFYYINQKLMESLDKGNVLLIIY